MTAKRPEIEEVCDCLAPPRFQVRLPDGTYTFWTRDAAEVFLTAAEKQMINPCEGKDQGMAGEAPDAADLAAWVNCKVCRHKLRI